MSISRVPGQTLTLDQYRALSDEDCRDLLHLEYDGCGGQFAEVDQELDDASDWDDDDPEAA